MKKLMSLALIAGLVASLASLLTPSKLAFGVHHALRASDHHAFLPKRIAHAGGSIDGRIYTNSRNALETNYAKGFRYFEVDLERTIDGKIVVLHDWDHAYQNMFGTPSLTHSAEEFLSARSPYGYEQLTDDTLIDWSVAHPDARIVLDIKNDYAKTINEFAAGRPNERVRFIPFMYDPSQLTLASGKGYENPLWLIDYAGTDDATVLSFVGTHPLTGVAMKAERTNSGLPAQLQARGVWTMAWTVDNSQVESMVASTGTFGLITNSLLPVCETTPTTWIAPLTQHRFAAGSTIPLRIPRDAFCIANAEIVLADRQRITA